MNTEDLISAVVIVVAIMVIFFMMTILSAIIVPVGITALAVLVVYKIIQEEKKPKS